MSTSSKRPRPLIIEGVRLVFRNFSGAKGKYNAEGMRNFGIILSDELAQSLEKEGWNVKYLKPREEEDSPQPWLKVKVSYRVRPPKVVLITSRGKTELDEDALHILDWAEISGADVKISGSRWEFDDEEGLSAYLDSIYITIIEDALELKYADVPDSARSSMEWQGDEDNGGDFE